jgi:hypothetical protein
MAASTYKMNKHSIYKWRYENREKYNEICKFAMIRHREWAKIRLVFLNVLLPAV